MQQLYKRCGRRDDVFKVVQKQEPVLVALRELEPFQQWLRSALGESNAVSDGRHHEGGIANGSEGDNVNTIREVMHQVPSDLERQTRFAHASRAGEGEQANVGAQQDGAHRGSVFVSSNQWGEKDGHRRGRQWCGRGSGRESRSGFFGKRTCKAEKGRALFRGKGQVIG